MDWSYNHQICTRRASWETLNWYWKWRSLTLTFEVILAFLTEKFSCSMRNLHWFWAAITKFAADMHLGIPTAGIENVGYWPWPSRAFGHFDSKFQESAFNIAFVFWSRPAKGWYTSKHALVWGGIWCVFVSSKFDKQLTYFIAHDDVMTSWLEKTFRITGHSCGESTGTPTKGQRHRGLMFSVMTACQSICRWFETLMARHFNVYNIEWCVILDCVIIKLAGWVLLKHWVIFYSHIY